MSKRKKIYVPPEIKTKADMPPDVPFSLACAVCDCDSPATFEEAVLGGWTEIIHDDGPSWNFLGYCPEHPDGDDGSIPPWNH